MLKIKKGLDLPIQGTPDVSIVSIKIPGTVALVGADYIGIRPTMLVQVGDVVKKGQPLFEDKNNPGVKFTSPVAGKVKEINRGEQRVFQSLVIAVAGNEEQNFSSFLVDQLCEIEREQIVSGLLESGLWTAFRTRPFSKIPKPAAIPSSIFVNVMDTNPLAFDPMLVVATELDNFNAGLDVLSGLAKTVFVCHGANEPQKARAKNIRYEEFSGVHPAGLPGTHIHFLDPVSEKKSAWTINCQDVIAIGKLFLTGKLDSERVVVLAGPAVKKPRLLKTLIGANLSELTEGELEEGENRIVSGSVLSGRKSVPLLNYLGRYHYQISVLGEGRCREFMGWFSPGLNKHSKMKIYLSQFFSGKKFRFTTSTHGSPRAIVPIGAYEAVMPLDILPTSLLRYLVVGDIEMATKLGALELDEEDLALCTYVCPGKYEYGPILRDNLNRIEQEG